MGDRVLGAGRYKAEVSADVDFSSVESTSEMFNPDQPALRSEQQVNEQRTSSLPPQGVPGALANQPPAAANAPEQAAGGAAVAGPVAAPAKPLLGRLLELVVFYFVVGALALVLERRAGQIAPQGWEFYAITGTMFLTFAFPGFVYRYLLRRHHS